MLLAISSEISYQCGSNMNSVNKKLAKTIEQYSIIFDRYCIVPENSKTKEETWNKIATEMQISGK